MIRTASVGWNDNRPISEILGQAQHASHLLIERMSGDVTASIVERFVAPAPTEICLIWDSSSPAARHRRGDGLPPFVNLIAVLPDRDASAAIPIALIEARVDAVRQSESLCELVMRLAQSEPVRFCEAALPSHPYDYPPLTLAARISKTPWLRRMVDSLKVPGASSLGLTALKAGLLLLNDFYDESHSYSQSIEGQGPNHTGDFWHAILHRREPDYGNARYWFRHVGRHPVFPEIARQVRSMLPDNSPGRLNQIVAGGEWNPIAFADVCAAAEQDGDLRSRWCEPIQFQEMLLLLDWTWCEATSS